MLVAADALNAYVPDPNRLPVKEPVYDPVEYWVDELTNPTGMLTRFVQLAAPLTMVMLAVFALLVTLTPEPRKFNATGLLTTTPPPDMMGMAPAG